MKDMLTIIYDSMLENATIKTECMGRIKPYIYPETGDINGPFITIRPLQPPQDYNYGSDRCVGVQLLYQVDVQSADRIKCKEIQRAVKAVMYGLGFSQKSGGMDEYFAETKRYVDARRYIKITNLYDTDY